MNKQEQLLTYILRLNNEQVNKLIKHLPEIKKTLYSAK